MGERAVRFFESNESATSAQELPPEAFYWARRQSLRPVRLFASTLLGFAFVFGMGWLSRVLDAPTEFDRALMAATHPRRAKPWAPSFATDRASLEAIDFALVHADLFPQWIIALQHDPFTRGQARETRRFEALMSEVGRERNLASLLGRLRDCTTSGVAAYAAEITHLLDGWNAYMEAAGLPWYVAHDVLKTARGGRLYTRSYRIHSELTAHVSGMPQHVRLLVRVDSTNVGELFFGQTDVDARRAVVVSDRIAEFALDRLWPLMDPDADDRLAPMDRAFAPFIRREAAGTLSSDAMSALRRGAGTRRVLQERLDAIVARKACGRGIEVENLPWNGLTRRGQAIVKRAVQHNEQINCTRLTREDAEVLLGSSNALAADDGLRVALGSLSAWLAKAVSAHEVRHLADVAHATHSVACEGCPPGMSDRGEAEVSAYTASMSTPAVGYLALYQACGVDLPTIHESGGALDFVLRLLMPGGCESGPTSNLYGQAQLLDWVLFKRVDRIELPSDFPSVLPLPAVRMGGVQSPAFETLANGPLQTRHGVHDAFPMRALL